MNDPERGIRVVDPPAEEHGVEVRRDEQREADLAIRRRGRRRQGRDDLARLAHGSRDLGEPLFEGRELEHRVDQDDRAAAPQALAKPVLLVLREGAQERAVETRRQEIALLHRAEARRAPARAVPGIARPAPSRARRSDGVPTHARHQREQRRHTVVEQPDDRRAEIDPPEAKAVENVLESVGESADGVLTEEAGQPFERVRRTEEAMDELRLDLPLAMALLMQQAEVPADLLEDLFRLGDELASVLRGGRPPPEPLVPVFLPGFRARGAATAD